MTKDLRKDDVNPYAAPEVEIGGTPAASSAEVARAEKIRRTYLNHEASVRAIGSLNILGAIIFGVAMVAISVAYFQNGKAAGVGASSQDMGFLIVMAIVLTVLAGLNLAVGIGLRRLQPWARWVDSAMIGLGLVLSIGSLLMVAMVGGNVGISLGQTVVQQIIPVYVFYLLLSKKGSMVFSPEYHEIIKMMPHVKYSMSCVVKGLLYVFLAFIGLAVIGGIVAWLTAKQ
jgi:hypothetical protein